MTPRAWACAGLGAIAAVVVWLHAPGLGTPLFADDYLQRAMLDGTYPIARAPWNLYAFYGGAHELGALTASGTLPWWIPPELRLSLLRPLPSLLLWLEHRVLGLSLFSMHLHSVAWLLAFLASFHALARRLLPTPVALLATALVGFDVALVSPVAWLCNRATLISATFAALGLWGYHVHRDTGSRRAGWLCSAGFALSFLGGEYAICALAFVLTHELVAMQGPLPARLRAASFAAVPAALYAAVHVLGGYGASGGSVYVSPLESPLGFLRGALVRVPSMLSTELLLLPGEAVYVALVERSPLLLWAVVPLAVVALLVAGALGKLPAPLPRRFAGYALGVVLALLPLSGTVPGVRLLLVPSMGGSLVLAAAFWGALRPLGDAGGRRRVAAWLLALLCLPLALLHLALSPLAARAQSKAHRDDTARLIRAALDSEIDDSKVAREELVLLNQPADLVAVNYTVRVRHEHGSPLPKSWRTLASALTPLTVARVADDALELRSSDPSTAFFNYDERRQENPDEPFRVGQRFSVPGLDVEIVEVRGWAPSRIRYRFSGSLDDPTRVFLRFEHGRLVRFPLPALGQEAPLPLGFP